RAGGVVLAPLATAVRPPQTRHEHLQPDNHREMQATAPIHSLHSSGTKHRPTAQVHNKTQIS
ncbi:unnamed protein product, partial [Bubo scandiacus]